MKKNILYIFACGAMILAAAACSKEQANNEPQEEPAGLITESFSAQKENEATKVTMTSSRVFGWSSSDKAAFSIYNDGTSSYDFVESDFYGTPIENKFTVTYTGTREGYAVIPSTFAKSLSADGNTLTVTYPTSYDISADVTAGCYDNADGAHFIPFPMVAVSDPGSDALTFYSIGALVKVTMNHIPAGTKKVYVTFNQTVTGDFTVATPGSNTPSVTVLEASTPSTVEIKISEDGLTAERDITLYIPVPTTTNLEISSSTSTKATVARNNGYAWSVDAISGPGASAKMESSSFYWYLSPGNLVRYYDDGVKYTFFDGYDQLKTTRGALDENPHRSGETAIMNVTSDGQYQDLFDWNDLYLTFTGAASEGGVESMGSKTITVDGVSGVWMMLNRERVNGLFNMSISDWRSKRNTIFVGGHQRLLVRSVEINVAGSDYAKYATGESSVGSGNFDLITGKFIFPDNYIDQTDLLFQGPSENYGIISYDTFKIMIDAGAYFMVAGGVYNTTTNQINEALTNFAYWLGEAESTDNAYRWYGQRNTSYPYMGIDSIKKSTYYRSVRLVRMESK